MVIQPIDHLVLVLDIVAPVIDIVIVEAMDYCLQNWRLVDSHFVMNPNDLAVHALQQHLMDPNDSVEDSIGDFDRRLKLHHL